MRTPDSTTRRIQQVARASALGLACALALGACQGNRADEPPVHIWWQMDGQKHFEAQEENDFFYSVDCAEEEARIAEEQASSHAVGFDKYNPPRTCFARAMREPPAGTVAVGQLKNDDHLHQGRDVSGRLVDELPPSVPLTLELLSRGEERYNIYCQPCHDYTGSGNGIVTRRGGGFQAKMPVNFHTDYYRAMPLGYFYDVIKNGKGTMQSYGAQIPTEDRWAIAVWVRTLQQSRTTLAMGSTK
ncbi:MAG: cytochrome c [Planctomycetes bacterium]|nr:cytochrome c [Planctomycetota bacterium]